MPNQSARLTKIQERERKYESVIEEKLGGALSRLGIPFACQEPIGSYFGDLYVSDRKTVIECDGRQFHTDKEYDEKRDAFMTGQGYRIIRIPGEFIHHHPIECAARVLKILDEPFFPSVVYLHITQSYTGVHGYHDREGYGEEDEAEEEAL